jgi:valyl-tRNA synthetase
MRWALLMNAKAESSIATEIAHFRKGLTFCNKLHNLVRFVSTRAKGKEDRKWI